MSACSCERLREIGDRTAQFVGFQFKECVDQAGALGASDLGEDRRLDLLVVLTPVGSSSKKLDVDLLAGRNLHHHGRAHSVFTLLIFLDLLERDAKGRAKVFLTYLGHHHQAT
jgi:hypothetical protein